MGTADVILLVFAYSELAQLQTLSHVCRGWHQVAQETLRKRIFLELQHHIKPAATTISMAENPVKESVQHFLALLARTRSVVSGSTAVAVYAQATSRAGKWMDTRDLDIFTPRHMASSVVEHLVQTHGYSVTVRLQCPASRLEEPTDDVFELRSDDIPSFLACNPSETGVYGLKRLATADGRRIDVIESSTDCALLPIVHFPFTHLINYITATSIVICYPHQTLVQGVSYIRPHSKDGIRLYERYRERRFKICDRTPNHNWSCISPTTYCSLRRRVSEDSGCFRMAFTSDSMRKERAKVIPYVPRAVWSWGETRKVSKKYKEIPGHKDTPTPAYFGHV